MTLPSTSTVLPTDAELLQIAVAPRLRLFPYLNRTSAIAPLILVCAIFPSLQLLTNPALDDEASLWGLRALSFAQASTIKELIQPGFRESGRPLIFQPPLAAWLNGISIRGMGTMHPWACSIVSLAATGVGIWLLTRIARRIGGANAALSSAILMATLPQTLRMSISPGNESLGFLLMLASVFGFQRHLEGKSSDLSLSLILSGITWGLSLLAYGPVAFLVPAVLVVHAANQRTTTLVEKEYSWWQRRFIPGWPVLRSAVILLVIGLALGGWWEIMLATENGAEFWRSWWSSLPLDCLQLRANERRRDACLAMMPTWRDWLNQNVLLIGWMIFGLKRTWNEVFRPTTEMARRRFQLLMWWWGLAFAGRILAEFAGAYFPVNTAVWNLACLAPCVLLASIGIGSLIERTMSQRSEFLLMVLLVTLTTYRISWSWFIGGAAGALVVILLLVVPKLIPGLGLLNNVWLESDWRQVLQVAVYVSLLACLAVGIRSQNARFQDEDHLAELRGKLAGIPEVSRISLVAARDPIPTSLKYLLRCRWPNVEIVTNDGWDAGLTRAMNEESSNPVSRFLILEWTRRNVHLAVDSFQAWQMKSLGDPIRVHGRRLSLILIEPQT